MLTAEEINLKREAVITEIFPFYRENKIFAFWHEMGLIGLGAAVTGLGALEALLPAEKLVPKAAVILLTALMTVIAACNHYFKFKSREDAQHRALLNLEEIGVEINNLKHSDGALLQAKLHDLQMRVEKCRLDADLVFEKAAVRTGK